MNSFSMSSELFIRPVAADPEDTCSSHKHLKKNNSAKYSNYKNQKTFLSFSHEK